jgi:5-methylcytosine-specific restriction endonuclease McrA
MNNDIAQKAIVLKLNANWKAVNVATVQESICDLITGVVEAIDIVYKINEDGSPDFSTVEYTIPVNWEQWIKLPIHPWHLSIHSTKMVIRVPTVVVAINYRKIHKKKYKGKPTKEALAVRDGCVDGYTGKPLDYDEATIDHVIPKARGGPDTFDNTVLTTKETNNRKGDKLNSEIGLKLHVVPKAPPEVLISHTIRKARHMDWKTFLEIQEK